MTRWIDRHTTTVAVLFGLFLAWLLWFKLSPDMWLGMWIGAAYVLLADYFRAHWNDYRGVS